MKYMKACLILVLLALASIAAAQDQIFKKDNTKVDAKILEINQTEVKYKLFTYQDGPTITISKSDVALIIYQNGSHEVFNVPATPTETIVLEPGYRDYDKTNDLKLRDAKQARQKMLFDTLTSTRQVVFFNVLDLFNGDVGLSYLREFAHNKLNVYVPLSVGFTDAWSSNTFNMTNMNFNNVANFKYDRKVFEAGLGINYQVSNRAVTYFVGPLFAASQFNGTYTQGNIYYYGSPSTSLNHSFVVNNYCYMINNGFLFRFTRNFNGMINAAMGYNHQDFISGHPANYYYYGYNLYSQFPINCLKLGLHLGYRF